jgi:hypothetical protein
MIIHSYKLDKLGSRSIGRDRTLARKLLADELKQINDIVVQLIDISSINKG